MPLAIMESVAALSSLPSKFCISAPGKVILHGEHSVVYGHLAIAASLNLKTKVNYGQLETSDASQWFAHFVMPNVGVDFTLSLRDIDNLMTLLACKKSWDFSCPDNVEFDTLVKHVQKYVESLPNLLSLSASQQLAMKTSLFLLVAILHHPNQANLPPLKPFKVQVTSELPVGAGAGSSASYCVSLATLFLCLASFRAQPLKQFCLDEQTKDLICKWAFVGEQITHGNPSGLDNSICTFGSLMSFRRPNTILKIPLNSGVRVLLVDTTVSRNTRTLVERVAKLREHHGIIVDTIMQAMDSISSEAEKLFILLDEAKRAHAEGTKELFLRMEELWAMNHSLLQALGVSHPSLERIVQVAREYNLCGKLTGAGGGGFAVILVPVNIAANESTVASLKQDLTNCGFNVRDVELGGPGVQLHVD